MATTEPDPAEQVSNRLSDLYVGLEDLVEDGSVGCLLKVLGLFQEMRLSMDIFERAAIVVLQRHQVSWTEIALSLGGGVQDLRQRFRASDGDFGVAEQHITALLKAHSTRDGSMLMRGESYTRNELREKFEIRDATLNNGVFHFKESRQVWLFITENKPADREQYVDKLTGNTLYWQGQKLGRTDPLIINHKQDRNDIIVFYRRAKYEFEGAGFRCEGVFDYISHSGKRPTDFILKRRVNLFRSSHHVFDSLGCRGWILMFPDSYYLPPCFA